MRMSEEEFGHALAWRNSKAARLIDEIGREVDAVWIGQVGNHMNVTKLEAPVFVVDANVHWVVLRDGKGDQWSFSLDKVRLSLGDRGLKVTATMP